MSVPLPASSFLPPLVLGTNYASSRPSPSNVVEVVAKSLGYSTNLFDGGRVTEVPVEAVAASMAVGYDVTEAAHYDPDLAGEQGPLRPEEATLCAVRT